jgi:hypothetical protein
MSLTRRVWYRSWVCRARRCHAALAAHLRRLATEAGLMGGGR